MKYLNTSLLFDFLREKIENCIKIRSFSKSLKIDILQIFINLFVFVLNKSKFFGI